MLPQKRCNKEICKDYRKHGKVCDYTDMGRGYQNQKYCGLHIKISPLPSQKAWMKLHDETATAIAFSFIDLETEVPLYGEKAK